ncbi:MAG: aminopeptidase [Candidatus Saccharibacteria bacterium]|nr:aminopeptidase [Candidatus Saccharibacteria bacterium]
MKSVSRLYEQFQPANYLLHLNPDPKAMTFTGTVTIRGTKAGRPSQRLTFHQKGLKITSARIIKHDKKGDQPVEIVRINNQDSFDEVRLHAAGPLYPGDYSVTMAFEGTITKPMHGIYPCYFTQDGTDKMLIATQFESHHAREAFPCVDEPEAKATFDLSLTSPVGQTAIANTPVKDQHNEGDQTVTSFETTPKMSTYLLAFIFGDLGYLEATTKNGVLVRTYATPDHVQETAHSLAVAVKVLEFFDDYFGIPYPLPKLDMAALPDFSSGAMENWGLVTYREVAMLLDDKNGTIESKQYIATVVAHELSHQWFGNLVTMKWWDDLWLNESFATLMEYRAVDAIYPEWHIWEQFISHEAASAKRRDSLVDVQPIRCEVNHPDEISSLFDPSIVYAKGGTVLHMLMHHIGEDAFRTGLRAYFEKHRYGNTRASDLWEAFSASSGQDIAAFMADWINKPGYPMVSVDWTPGSGKAALSQQRFLSDPAASIEAGDLWQTPLAATAELGTPVLSLAKDEVAVPTSNVPFLLNHDGHSYFVPRYENAAHRQSLVQGIADGQIDTIDRLLLLDNFTMLQRGGFISTVDALELLAAYEGEQAESVWGAIAMPIAEARRLIEGHEPSEAPLNRLISKLTAPLVAKLGWDDAPDDDASTLRLRGLVISLAVGAKTPELLEEGRKRFASFTKPEELSPSTRSVVYFVGARHGSKADFDKLIALHNTSTSADERDEIASALTSTQEPANHSQLLEMLTGDDIRRQDLMHWWVWLLRNRFARDASWDWLVSHWGWIEKEFASDKSYSYFARYASNIYSTDAEFQKFQDFFGPKKSQLGLARDIILGEQEITSRIAWRQRNETDVKAWLAKRVP